MGGFVGDVVSFFGRPFGIYDHEEILTDISVTNLLTPGVAEADARRAAKRSAYGNAMDYFTGYRTFQREYKKRYGPKTLEKLGYAPYTTASSRTLDSPAIEVWLENDTGYTDVDVTYARDEYIDDDQKYEYALANTVGWDIDNQWLIDTGKKYYYDSHVNTNSTTVDITFIRDHEETIIENLTNNYSYDSMANTIEYLGDTYNVGALSDTLNGSDQYETICTHASLPDITIYTNAQRIVKNYVNALFDQELTFIEYRVTSGEVTNATRYFLALADTISDFYTTTTIDATAIVPLKEGNVIVDLGNNSLKRILRKVNLDPGQLRSSLENPDMDAAYLMTGLDFRNTDEAHNKVFFQSFDLMSDTNGNVTTAINYLSMTYTYGFEKETIQGVVGAVGSYTREDRSVLVSPQIDDEEGGGFVPAVYREEIILRYQGSASEYQEITISDFTQQYTISGQSITVNARDPDGTCRLVIPLSVYNGLRYKEWVVIYEKSLSLIAYAFEVVEVAWYETGAFGFILKVIAVVLLVASMGSSADFSAFLWSAAQSFVIYQVAIAIAEAIGGVFGAIVAAVAAVYAMYQTGQFDGVEGLDLWLKMADTALTTFSQAIEQELASITAEGNSAIDSIQEKIDELKEQNEEFVDNYYIYGKDAGSNNLGRPNSIFQTTEQYVNSIVNTEWLVDGSWMYNIDQEIATRNSVYVG